MTTTGQAPEPGSARWLADQAAAEPGVLAKAGQVLAAGRRSNDTCLIARRFVESAWNLRQRAPDYQRAADLLDRAGKDRLAEIFRAIDTAGAELAAASQAWQARWAACPAGQEQLAARFAAGLIELSGAPVLGVDGAWYQPAACRAGAGEQRHPAVLVSAMATRELVTGFTGQAALTAWLRTRDRAAARAPLAEPAVAPLPRLVLEERVLAWLIRHPYWLPPGFGDDLRARLWTADCRHEIDAALRTAGTSDGRQGYPGVVRELRRRTLRAPDWAGDLIGWPDGRWVQQYLWRLAATRVPLAAARDAFQALIAIPAAIPAAAPAPAPAPAPARPRPAPARQARPATAHDQYAAALYDPSYPRPGSAGTRMRITRPGPRP